MEKPNSLADIGEYLANMQAQFKNLSRPDLSKSTDELSNMEFVNPYEQISDAIEYLNAMILAVKNLSGIDQYAFERQVMAELTALKTKRNESSSGSGLG